MKVMKDELLRPVIPKLTWVMTCGGGAKAALQSSGLCCCQEWENFKKKLPAASTIVLEDPRGWCWWSGEPYTGLCASKNNKKEHFPLCNENWKCSFLLFFMFGDVGSPVIWEPSDHTWLQFWLHVSLKTKQKLPILGISTILKIALLPSPAP